MWKICSVILILLFTCTAEAASTTQLNKTIAEDPEGFKATREKLFGAPKNKKLLEELGSVLASEKFCGFKYDMDAVDGLIARTKAADYTFSKDAIEVDFLISRNRQAKLFGEAKADHCRLIAAVAVARGFIK